MKYKLKHLIIIVSTILLVESFAIENVEIMYFYLSNYVHKTICWYDLIQFGM